MSEDPHTRELGLERTGIPGLVVLRLPVHEDARGWFKEAWQREKMMALGLPDFAPVQANVSWNATRGTTRGLHAEPWDKLVSVSTGRAFGAWVDLREGASFGSVFSVELDTSVAVFVPRGVANSYQTLTDGVAYSYLVNDHWHPGPRYPALALDDPTAAIEWPIPLAEAEVSAKDRANPPLEAVDPVPARVPLVLGAHGQVGRALARLLPDARLVGRDELDLTDADAVESWVWDAHDVVLNAAAWTAVDAAELPENAAACWRMNATLPAQLARLSREHRFTLVHFSSDYVYDGVAEVHTEDEPLAPLGVYGASKAAGDLAVSVGSHRHLLLRTSWVVGDGSNFVTTMARLADDGVRPTVVADQVGRLTFADDLAQATLHLLDHGASGVVHVSSAGEARSWSDLARVVFAACGRDPADVVDVTTTQWSAGRQVAARPAHSTLDLTRLQSTGFVPVDLDAALDRYLRALRGT